MKTIPVLPEVRSIWLRKKFVKQPNHQGKQMWKEVIILDVSSDIVLYGPISQGANTRRTTGSFLLLYKPKMRKGV